MRAILLILASLLALVGPTSARAQWTPGGPYTFVQGQTYDLYFEQPALNDFLAADIFVRYSPDIFEPVQLLPGTPAALADLIQVSASSPKPYAGGQQQVQISVNPSFSNPLVSGTSTTPGLLGDYGMSLPNGKWFGVRFSVKMLGTTDTVITSPSAEAILSIGDSADLDGDPLTELLSIPPLNVTLPTTILAVPEPGAWAMMLAGLAFVGACAMRRRRAS